MANKPIRNAKDIADDMPVTPKSKKGFLRVKDVATEAAVSSSLTLKKILDVNSKMGKSILSGFGGKGIFGGLASFFGSDSFLKVMGVAGVAFWSGSNIFKLIDSVKELISSNENAKRIGEATTSSLVAGADKQSKRMNLTIEQSAINKQLTTETKDLIDSLSEANRKGTTSILRTTVGILAEPTRWLAKGFAKLTKNQELASEMRLKKLVMFLMR